MVRSLLSIRKTTTKNQILIHKPIKMKDKKNNNSLNALGILWYTIETI